MKNYLNILLILSMVLMCQTAMAQYELEWAIPFGGDGWDEANTCIETRDGDIMVGGFAKQQQHHLWMVKAKGDGKGRWGKIFPDYLASSCKSMVQDRDSNIVLAGYAIRKGQVNKDILVMKIDTLGNVLWHKTYGGILDEEAYKIIACAAGGYALCGYTSTNNDGEPNWDIMRIDDFGNIIWKQEYGMSQDDRALSLAETWDNGIIVTGYVSNGNGSAQKLMTTVKFNKDGEYEWLQTYDHNMWSCGTAIIQTRDSLIMSAGYTRVFSITDYDVLVVKTDMYGDTLWTRTYGNEDWQEATDIIETYDNAFVVCGFSQSNSKELSSFLTLKYDAKGNLIWHNIFKRRSKDYAKSVFETHDNGLLIGGTTFSLGKGWDMAVMKMKNIESTDLKFTFPTDTLTTSLIDHLTVEMCLKSFGVPNDVKVFVNNKIQIVDAEFSKPREEDRTEGGCDFPLAYTVQLEPGINVIKLEIRDYKRYLYEKQIIVYRMPTYDFVR